MTKQLVITITQPNGSAVREYYTGVDLATALAMWDPYPVLQHLVSHKDSKPKFAR